MSNINLLGRSDDVANVIEPHLRESQKIMIESTNGDYQAKELQKAENNGFDSSNNDKTNSGVSDPPGNMDFSIPVVENSSANVVPDTKQEIYNDNDEGSGISDGDTNSEADNEGWKGKVYFCVKSLYASRVRVLMVLLTVSSMIVTLYLGIKKPYKEWLNIAVWRWTTYFTLLFPSWTLTYYILQALIFITFYIGQCCCEGPESKRRAQDLLLFWERYSFANKVFLWACLLTLIFALVFAPIYESESTISDGSLQKWEDIYGSLLNIHVVFLLFAFGNLMVEFIEFKYLTKLSVRNQTPKIDENIFQEAVLLTLAGYRAQSKLKLLSTDSDPQETFQIERNQERRTHVVARYIRENDLVKSLSVKMRLGSENKDDVIKSLVRKIRTNVRNTKHRQIRGIRGNFNGLKETELDDEASLSQKGTKYATPRPFSIFSKQEIIAMHIPEKVNDHQDTWPKRSPKGRSGHRKIGRANSDDRLDIRAFSSTVQNARPSADNQKESDVDSESYVNMKRTSSRRSKGVFKKEHLEIILCKVSNNSVDVDRAMGFLDPLKDGQEYISVILLEEAIDKTLKDRKNLAWSLKDAATITAQIKNWVWWGMMVVVLLCSLLTLGVRGVDTWVGFSTFILGLSFIFGGAVKNAFENFLFLLGGHPFDVGDKIYLGGSYTYEVKRVSLQTTELDHFGEVRVVQNSVVRSTEPLVNLSRSTSHRVSCSYLIDARLLSEEFLEKLKSDMMTFVQKDPETYQQDTVRIDCYEFVPPEKVP